jgi:hypothetical protein
MALIQTRVMAYGTAAILLFVEVSIVARKA